MASLTLKSKAGLATLLSEQVLRGKINSDEALQILVCYLIRAGVITEVSLPTPTE